jgi:GTP:adenosylcobinamide-phosphate guanylyltransferase
MQAIVLAGQENSAFTTAWAGRYEAEVPILGRPMVAWVLDALKEAESVDQVILVGPSVSWEGIIEAPIGETLWDSLDHGLSRLSPDEERVLILTADIPLITGTMVDAFVKNAPWGADLVYPVISKSRTLEKFPETKRTYVRLAGLTVTGGNMVVANPQILPVVAERAKQLIRHRKSPLRLARDVGLVLLLRLLSGRLSLSEAERRVSQVFGIRGRVVECPYPEIGVDVDKMSDLTLVERILADRASTSSDSSVGGHAGG